MHSEKAERIFAALGDKTRLEIVRLLLGRENVCVNDILVEIGTSQPNISQQIRVLKNAGIVRVRKKGRKCCCKIANPEEIREILRLAEKGGKNEDRY